MLVLRRVPQSSEQTRSETIERCTRNDFSAVRFTLPPATARMKLYRCDGGAVGTALVSTTPHGHTRTNLAERVPAPMCVSASSSIQLICTHLVSLRGERYALASSSPPMTLRLARSQRSSQLSKVICKEQDWDATPNLPCLLHTTVRNETDFVQAVATLCWVLQQLLWVSTLISMHLHKTARIDIVCVCETLLIMQPHSSPNGCQLPFT